MTEESTNQGPPEHTEAPGRQCRVFISYASHDAAVAQKVCSELEAAGFPCWIAPRNVVPGTLYAEGIVHAIDESSILVLILSEQAVASAHVGREIERAVSKRHPVVALRIDTAPLAAAFEYFLNQSQWIEGGGSDAAIAQLVEAVGQHLSPGSATAPIHALPTAVRRAAMSQRVWAIAAVVVAVALVGTYFLVDKTWLSGHVASKQDVTATAVVVSDKSIAVLPFADMSEKKDQEYFADGMAEEILDLLVKIPGLKVIGRTSSFQFKGKSEDLRTIGTQLGVAYVLEGSVRKSGDRLRVTAQLINSGNGTHLWSQTYDRDISDVFKVQDEIAAKVARALQIEVGVRFLVSRPGLRSSEAYTLFLQGQHALERYDQQGWDQALSDTQRALELDPSYAEAAGTLAMMYHYAGQVGIMTPDVAFEKTRDAAKLALKLDPNFAGAHALLGSLYGEYQWDWPAADKEIKQALALAPNEPGVLWAATVNSMTLGRWDDALKLVNAWVEVDPLNSDSYFWLSIVQQRLARLPEAEAAIRRTIELSPTNTLAEYNLCVILLARNQPDAALTESLKEPYEAARLTGSALAYFALGRRAHSDAALAQAVKNPATLPSGIGAVYAYRGEADEAFNWLDRAFKQKDPLLSRLKYSTEFDNLHGDPRYKAFLKKMNLPSD
jgi:TolB-like protein